MRSIYGVGGRVLRAGAWPYHGPSIRGALPPFNDRRNQAHDGDNSRHKRVDGPVRRFVTRRKLNTKLEAGADGQHDP